MCHILFEYVHIQITLIAFESRTWMYFSSSHNASSPLQKTYIVNETFSDTLYLAVCQNNIYIVYTVCYLFWNVQNTFKSNVPITFVKWNVTKHLKTVIFRENSKCNIFITLTKHSKHMHLELDNPWSTRTCIAWGKQHMCLTERVNNMRTNTVHVLVDWL